MSEIINKTNIPKHIAITMDGNGRWAKERGKKRVFGHNQGVKSVRDTIEGAVEYGVEFLTLFAFSTENWKRPKAEINSIKKLVIKAINDQVPELKKQKVKLKFFGHLDDFGKKIQDKISFAEKETCTADSQLNLNVALGYGGQQDIIDIVKRVSKEVASERLNIEDIDGKIINEYSSVPVDEIDLLIRTGGDKRISNFLLYQIAYAEIMFVDKFWPDFTRDDFSSCLNNFKKVSRRFGKRI